MNTTTTTDDSTDDRTIVTVRVASAADAFDDLEERFAALDADDQPEPHHEVIVQREEDLTHLFRPTNVELLQTIARESPESIRETARLVDRDVRQVHDNLNELARVNLLQFEDHGRAKRPVVWYDDIDIELPITSADESATVP